MSMKAKSPVLRSIWAVVVLTLLGFSIHFVIDELYFAIWRFKIDQVINFVGISHLLSYILVGSPIFISVLVLHGFPKFFTALGLKGSIRMAFIFAMLCTLPMLIGFSFFYTINQDLEINRILISIVCAGFFEELYFRAFLFGQLYRFTNLGFIPAVLLGAVIFASVHLYQSTDPSVLFGIFAVTFAGGLLFAWLYVEWNYNLWVPIGLHFFMNLSWEIFAISDNALGSASANIFRALTIAASIILTLLWQKGNGYRPKIKRDTLLWQDTKHT